MGGREGTGPGKDARELPGQGRLHLRDSHLPLAARSVLLPFVGTGPGGPP